MYAGSATDGPIPSFRLLSESRCPANHETRQVDVAHRSDPLWLISFSALTDPYHEAMDQRLALIFMSWPGRPTTVWRRVLLGVFCAGVAISGQAVQAEATDHSLLASGVSDAPERANHSPAAALSETVLTSTDTQISLGPLKIRYSTLLGELDYSIFMVGTISGDPGAFPFVFDSAGLFLATNPAEGGARWEGQVAGIDSSAADSGGNMILGVAEVVLTDFADPRVDVVFSGLQDLGTGSARDDMSWLGLQVTDGAFFALEDSSSITGRFYGPQQQEVGGTFDRNQIVGAFGGSRDIATAMPGTGGIGDVVVDETDLDLPLILETIAVRFEVSSLHRPDGHGDARVLFSHQADGNEFGFYGDLTQLATWVPESLSYYEQSEFGLAFGFEGLDLSIFPDLLSWKVFSSTGPTLSRNPQVGSARWRGTFLGVDDADSDASYRGDVLLVIPDFVNPAVDVWFRNTVEINSNTSLPDVLWLAVPVTRGAFRARGGDGWIAGRFYGADQQEASGTVRDRTISGVFSARREPAEGHQAVAESGLAEALQVLGYAAGLEELPDLMRSRGGVANGSGEDPSGASDRSPGLLTTLFSGSGSEALETFDSELAALVQNASVSPSIEFAVDGGDLPGGRFGVLRLSVSGPGGDALPSTVGFTYGVAMTVNPLGGTARWTGTMVGFDITDTEAGGNKVEGVADLVVQDFSVPEIDVSFTDIRDLDLAAPLADMRWDAIPLRDGAFRSAQPNSVIDGRLYGADHTHVGGVFEHDGIVGAFGAERPLEP